MAVHFPIVFEQEDSGAYSAYVAGLPVYAQGRTRAQTASAIVRTLRAYLEAHPQQESRAEVQVARVSASTNRFARPKVNLVTAAARDHRRMAELSPPAG
jgi:predicted RNase H-like HicB family nuclease